VPDPNTFTGAELDRAADGRRLDAAWIHEQMSHPAARAVLAADAGVRLDDGRLALVPLAEAPAPVDDGVPVLLGLDSHGPLFAIDEGPAPEPGTRPAFVGAGGRRGEPAPEDDEHVGLRDAAQVLGQADGGLAAYATAMLNWHRGHSFCPNCASETDVAEGGLVRRCPTCGLQHHPRIDPVVIMLVTDGAERVLLGRQRVWPPRRYSALAGFVGPGESLEEAVAREVFEEAGVRIDPPRYQSSQPWPFPVSLMLGFEAPFREGNIGGSDSELEDARWFTRDEVAAAAADDSWEAPDDEGEGLLLPPRSAIARRLIEGWLERPG
jgi:NAD+ diphosphatase